MPSARGMLWTFLLIGALGAPEGLRGQVAAAGEGLGEAAGCTRSRIRVAGSVKPVTAETHTFVGRFVRAFARYVPPGARPMRGTVEVGVGGPLPLSVAFALTRPVAYPELPDLREDRLAPEQHRVLHGAIGGALGEIGNVPDRSVLVTLVLEGAC